MLFLFYISRFITGNQMPHLGTTDTNFADKPTDSDLFLNDVLHGLRQKPRHLPCKYFYDEYGSKLFDAICELDEYYLTRTELRIMELYATEMAEVIGPRAMLVEYGSGSSIKSRLLLDSLIEPTAYVPIDISGEHLNQTASVLCSAYPALEVLPVCADFTESFALPDPSSTHDRVAVYFPGSTIGNFQPDCAENLLRQIAAFCGQGGGLLIGIDLQKEIPTIEAAYNDSQGVTAEFNLNLLHRINRELAADFDTHQFKHLAHYDVEHNRIKINLSSQCEQTVTVNGERFLFEKNEEICTEYSHKYTIEGFAKIAQRAGFELGKAWTDPDAMFGVLHLTVVR